MVHQPQSHGKGKAKQNQNNNKPKQTTTFKKKKKNREDGVASCADLLIIGRKPQPKQKAANMVVFISGGGTSGYDNLPYVLSVFQSTTWWLDSGANVNVCSDASLFSSY
jgi:hypothetical protein